VDARPSAPSSFYAKVFPFDKTVIGILDPEMIDRTQNHKRDYRGKRSGESDHKTTPGGNPPDYPKGHPPAQFSGKANLFYFAFLKFRKSIPRSKIS